jgi:hypothetical protein
MKYLILFIFLIGCTVQESLLVPNCNDYVIYDVSEKYIYMQNSCEKTRMRNRVGMTKESIGDWLIMEDEFRYKY